MRWPRPTVYIANILKCRPPGNRDPSPEESACCTPYLHRQIELIQPLMILAVGRSPGEKRRVWDDLKFLKAELERQRGAAGAG